MNPEAELPTDSLPPDAPSAVKLGLVVDDDTTVEDEPEERSVCVSGFFPWLPTTPASTPGYRPPHPDPEHGATRMLENAPDLLGRVFGLLRVDRASSWGRRGIAWDCRCTGCDRGIRRVRASKLLRGEATTCGSQDCKRTLREQRAKAA